MSIESRTTQHNELVERLTMLADNPQLGEQPRELARAWYGALQWCRDSATAPLSIALFAEVGRGKSSLTAAATGLRLHEGGDPRAWSVLPVGDGRTTLGETRVVFEQRSDVLLEVDPIPDVELQRELRLFAEDVWAAAAGTRGQGSCEAGEELYALFRAWLVPDAENRRSELVKIARSTTDAADLMEHLLELANLEQRAQPLKQLFSNNKAGLTSLRQTLVALMRGTLDRGPAPRVIRLHVPPGNLGDAVGTVIDTQGIDLDVPGLVDARPDLYRLLRDPNTLPVVCSQFETAPDATSQALLKILEKPDPLRESRRKGKVRLVIVDRRAIPDEDSLRQQHLADADDRAQMSRDKLRRAQLDAEVVVLNACGEANDVQAPLRQWASGVREARMNLWASMLDGAAREGSGFGDQVFSAAASKADLALWWAWDVGCAAGTPIGLAGSATDRGGLAVLPILIPVTMEHWSHLHATIRRRGRYSKLDLAALGARGAADLATLPLRKALGGEMAMLEHSALDSDRLAAHRKLRLGQFANAVDVYHSTLYERWRTVLVGYFASPLSDGLWQSCRARWGQGPGYVEAVQKRIKEEALRAKLDLGSEHPVKLLRKQLPPRPKLLLLSKITLRNFRGVEEQTLKLTATTAVLVGDNGRGKTSWLEAAVAGLGALLPGMGAGAAPPLVPADVRQTTREIGGVPDRQHRLPMEIRLEASMQGSPIEWTRRIERLGLAGVGTDLVVAEDAALQLLAREIGDEVRAHSAQQLPVLAYYGTQRLWPTAPVPDTQIRDVGSRLDGYRDCLAAASTHQHMLEWVRHFTLVELQRKSPVVQLRAIERAVVMCVENATGFRYDLAHEELQIAMDDGTTLSFQMLSDGYRNMVAMVADIAWRASVLNPQLMADAPALAQGVVLIDEIDLHLHPKWQRRVLGDLRRAFPLLQFVATTHSPFIIQSLAEGELVNLDPEAPQAPYADESPEDIAERVMGVDVPQRSERRRRAVEAAERYYDLLEQVPTADERELAKLKSELDTLLAPYSDNQAFVALLSRKRVLAEAKRS